MEAMIGALTVFLFAMARFNVPPPSQMTLPVGLPRSLEDARKWFWVKSEGTSTILPPPRANTTVFRFWLYRISYSVIAVGVYVVISKVPGVIAGINLMAEWAGLESLIPANTTPFMLALVVLLLPVLPVFKVADACIRRGLYIRALIPAEQLRLSVRLKKAAFEANAALLAQVRGELEVEGFDRGDIVLEPKPTTSSLWTKAVILMEQIERWEGLDKYKTAFAVVRELGSEKRSCKQVKGALEALKGDAKTCFRALREQPGHEETQLREERFRRDCKALLESIYTLLSRVSLHSHYSARERVTSLREIGFHVEPRQGGPVPDSNDIVWLLVLIGAVVILPLWQRLDPVRALAIGSIYFTAVLTPLLLAAYCPVFAMGRGARTPPIACPVVSGVIAALVGIVISVVSNSLHPAFPWIDVVKGWQGYVGRSYPWSFLVFLVAALISIRIRSGTYPDVSSLNGLSRYREWGNLTDGLILAGSTALLMMIIVIPQLIDLTDGRFQLYDATWWRRVLIPTTATFVIGFFVPTWYRANRLRMGTQGDEVVDEQPSPGQTAAV